MTADADDDLIVEIPSDIIELGHDADGMPKAVPGKAAAAAPVERAEPDADAGEAKAEADRIAKLEREAEEARREAAAFKSRAETAETVAREALVGRSKAEETAAVRTEQTIRAHMAKVVADHDTINGGINATKAQLAAAKREYQAAREAGDTNREIEAAEALADAKAALQNLEAGKAAALAEVHKAKELYDNYQAELQSRPPPKPVEEPKRPPTPEEWIDGTRSHIGDRGAEWLRANKDFVTDPKLNKKFLRFADEYADDFGQSALRSQDFIKALNEKFSPSESDGGDDVADNGNSRSRSAPVEAEKPRARSTPSAAPVSRGNNLFSSRNPNAKQVKLPPKLAAKVREMGLDPVQYALGAVEDIKAGRLDKNFLDPDYPH